jgi:hypothetical protein
MTIYLYRTRVGQFSTYYLRQFEEVQNSPSPNVSQICNDILKPCSHDFKRPRSGSKEHGQSKNKTVQVITRY